jgi:hypothetical protein
MCYLSAGMRKGWVVVTLFGGLFYLVEATTEYSMSESKQFSIFYDASSKRRFSPIVLANEMTLIGHALSRASKFENRSAIDEQWFPLIAAFCEQKGIALERIGGKESDATDDPPSDRV